MDPDEYKRQLIELRGLIIHCIAYFTAWQNLAPDDASLKAINRYKGLFVPAQIALLWMAILQLAKIFDKDPRTISLRILHSEALKNRPVLTPYITIHELHCIGDKIGKNEEALKRLKTLRDKRIAHHDADISDLKSVFLQEITPLIEDAKFMHDELSRGHYQNVTAFESISEQAERDTRQVVQIMREDREKARRRLKDIGTTQ